jgi:hypothetical protein
VAGGAGIDGLLQRFHRGKVRLRVRVADETQHPPPAGRAERVAKFFTGNSPTIKPPAKTNPP